MVALALLMAGCGTAEPPPSTATSEDRAGRDETDGRADPEHRNGLCAAAERVEAAHEDLFEGHAGHLESSSADAAGGWPGPEELRAGASVALRLSDSISELADRVEEPHLQAPLETWAESFAELAAFYAEIDYDLEQLDTADEQDMARLAEVSLPVLLGPPWDDEEEVAFDQLLTALAEQCPQLELGAAMGEIEPERRAVDVEPEELLDSHTVTLTDDAVARIREASRHAMALEERERGGGWGPCPLWDPEEVVAAVGGYLDEGYRPTEVIMTRAVAGDGWAFGCALVRSTGQARHYSYQQLQVHAMALDRLPEGVRDGRLADAQRVDVEGHAIFEHELTFGSRDTRYEAFAADADHHLAVLVEAETAELARRTLVVVLDGLTTT